MMDTHYTQESPTTTRLANDWLVMIQRHQSIVRTQHYLPYVFFLLSAIAFILYYVFSLGDVFYFFGTLLWISALIGWLFRKKNQMTFWDNLVKLPLKEQLTQIRPFIVEPRWKDYVPQFLLTLAIIAFIPLPTFQIPTLNDFLFALVGATLAVVITYYRERSTWKKESSLVEEMTQTIL